MKNRFVVPSQIFIVAIFVGLCYHPCMFIRIKSTPNSPRKSVQIVASVRDGNKVRQKIMRHVGVAQNDAELAQLKELAEFIKTQMEEEHQPQLFPDFAHFNHLPPSEALISLSSFEKPFCSA